MSVKLVARFGTPIISKQTRTKSCYLHRIDVNAHFPMGKGVLKFNCCVAEKLSFKDGDFGQVSGTSGDTYLGFQLVRETKILLMKYGSLICGGFVKVGDISLYKYIYSLDAFIEMKLGDILRVNDLERPLEHFVI